MVVDLWLLTLLFLYLLLTEAPRHASRSSRDILVELKGGGQDLYIVRFFVLKKSYSLILGLGPG